MPREIAMLHDISKCTACRGCMVACKQWKQLPADITPFKGDYQSHKDLSPITYNIVKMRERNVDGKLRWDFFKFQCLHCGLPGCVTACPTNALTKNYNGPVTFDHDLCIGCKYCELGCPFNVPKVSDDTGKVEKCDLCMERIEEGMVPACAFVCPSDAVLFGSRDDMAAIAEKRIVVLKQSYPNAQLYGVSRDDKIWGCSMMYILTDHPREFGLPEDPQLSASLNLWKNVVHPVGKAVLSAAAVGVAGLTVYSSIKRAHKKQDAKED